MGSVKDLEVLKNPTREEFGIGQFIFSNRYSVFDWKEMPDLIPQKGEASCLLSSYFFERLEEMGIFTHYLGLVEDGKIKRLDELERPTNVMEIRILRVLKPEFKNGNYDYSIFQKEKSLFLIPLEVIYRNYLASGSSVFRRLKEGKISLKDLGLDKEPQAGQRLEKPMLDVSTKLERIDRYLSWKSAQEISGLEDEEIEELQRTTNLVNNLITDKVSNIGLLNEDGKLEFGFDKNRNLILIDVLGTLDECRFTYQGLPISKEIARIYYRKTNWYEELEKTKKKETQNFKELCKLKPEPLPSGLKLLISELYCACCNEITNREWFPVSPLREIVKGLKEYL